MGKVEELQLVQQNLQHILDQKQSIESELTELNSALTELKNTDKAYKIVGKIMIATNKNSLIKDLDEQKNVAETRLKTFSTQEKKIKQQLEKVQKEAMEEMKDE